MERIMYQTLEAVVVLNHGAWGVALWLMGVALTLTWGLVLRAKYRRPVAYLGAFSVLLISGLGLVILAFLILHFFHPIGMYLVASIPLVGRALAQFASPVISFTIMVTLLYALIYIGPYFWRELGRNWEYVRSGRSIHAFVLGAIAIAMVVNSPVLNERIYYAPAVASALLGIYTLISARSRWQDITREVAIDYVMCHGRIPYYIPGTNLEKRAILEEALKRLEGPGPIQGDELEASMLDIIEQKKWEREERMFLVSRRAELERIKNDIRTYLESPMQSAERLRKEASSEPPE